VIPALFIVAAVLLDQAVKYWAVNYLLGRGSIGVIPGVFSLTFATNNGAALNLFAGARWLLIAVTVIAIGVIIYMLAKSWFDRKLGKWAAYFILAGALGNFIDRAFRDGGLVVDLFYIELIDFPIFNVADIFVSAGGVMFALYVIGRTSRENREGKERKDGGGDEG